ncbi:ribbon-helix-helix protein, CopG family [Trichlorobacter ammonificans]|uniref:Ribbon-helix-helix protein, CopG family n=1 Tax=Trichlorobacter ammonificans TaxID=2916410 RepID=A0ABN8HJG2_9BACT|nr:ribbon-helix-helix protein, CopG family [Trichlorobacter ammonificans]CAH2031475.1 Ribbon-helix-helix protein, CopG family [Trichlorobacter ammonificans]
MGRMIEKPRYNVISMRISAQEREYLNEIMERTNMSMSEIMREAMRRFAGIPDDRDGVKEPSS